MVENATSTRKLIGNACLHYQLSSSRSFLRRNIRHILDAHEKLLKSKPDNAPREDMIANERRASGWDFPTKEMLGDLTKGEKPVLCLDALYIRHPKSASKKRKRDSRDDHNEHLDWLPDPEALATWPCQVTIDVREAQTSKRSIHVESRHATISHFQQTSDGHGYFKIALEKPFLVEVSKLFVAVETGTNGFRHWRRTVTTKYSLQISIQCRDSDDMADFLSELYQRSRAKFERIPGSEGTVRASWEELPQVPRPGQLLPLKKTDGHQSRSPEYELELSMGWSRKRESPLQRFNRALVKTRGQNTQLLTPSSESTGKECRHVITYKFREDLNTKVKEVDGLCCPLCKEQPKSLPRLLLHFSTFHDHFKFEVQESQQDQDEDGAVVRRTILLTLAPPQYEMVTGKGEEERCNWIAPTKPFDLQAHLEGDHSWTGHAKAKSTKRRGRQAGVHFKDSQPMAPPRPAVKRPTAGEVKDLPANGHRRYTVPDVPGVRFYHSLSKKPIEPGEVISDSDESVDECWMMDVERQALKELSINGASQEFTIAFNHHLAREQSSSSILMKEAIVRFTRLHRQQLQDVGWQRPFRKKLEQLRGAGVINQSTVTHCIQLLQTQEAGEDVEMMNGIPETSGQKTMRTHNEPQSGTSSHHDMSNGVRKPAHTIGQTSKIPPQPPSARNTVTTNGERKSRGRFGWGPGGPVSLDAAQPSSSIDRGTPNGASPAANGELNGRNADDDAMDIDQRDGPGMDEAGFRIPGSATKAKGKVNGDGAAQPRKRVDMKLCSCGKPNRHQQAIIRCKNPQCAVKTFHVDCVNCVGLIEGFPNWRCRDCRA